MSNTHRGDGTTLGRPANPSSPSPTAAPTTVRLELRKDRKDSEEDTSPDWRSWNATRPMRVLFYYRGIESLGIGYLMSMMRAAGHQVDLIFEPGLDDNGFLNLPLLARLNHTEALLERARRFNPDLVAIGATTNMWSHAAKWARLFKEHLGVPIVVGGHHAQALPEVVLSDPNVDIACIGEGEIALLELVNRMAAGEDYSDVPTMWVRTPDGIVRNAIGPLENHLDRFPYPEKALWYEYGAFRHNLEVFTGRGCRSNAPSATSTSSVNSSATTAISCDGAASKTSSPSWRPTWRYTTPSSSRCTTTTSRPTSAGWRSSARSTETGSACRGSASVTPPPSRIGY